MTDAEHLPDAALAFPGTVPEVLVPASARDPDAVLAVPADTSFEVALDDEVNPGAPVYVDVTAPAGQRLPVLPDFLRGIEGMKRGAGRAGGRAWHSGRYHGLRSPVYLLAGLWWALVGVVRVTGRQLRWWWLLEQHHLRTQAVISGDSREWMRLHKEAKETRRIRGYVLAGEVIALVAAGVAMWLLAPGGDGCRSGACWWCSWPEPGGPPASRSSPRPPSRPGSASCPPTSCCAPTTRRGSATGTSRTSGSRSGPRWPATVRARGSWSTCPTALAWTTPSRPRRRLRAAWTSPSRRCSSGVTRPATADTRCG